MPSTKPAKAKREEHAVFVSGTRAEASAGVVHHVAAEIERLIRPPEPVDAPAELGREIHRRAISRRNVRRTEQDAAREMGIRHDVAARREIPLRKYRFQAHPVNTLRWNRRPESALGRSEDDVQGKELAGKLIVSPQPSGEIVVSYDPPQAAAGYEKSCVRRFGSYQSAAGKNAQLPRLPCDCSCLSRLGYPVLRHGRCCE